MFVDCFGLVVCICLDNFFISWLFPNKPAESEKVPVNRNRVTAVVRSEKSHIAISSVGIKKSLTSALRKNKPPD